jgi:hypothetical protein
MTSPSDFQGATGATGAAGATGATGATGAAGATGATGAIGLTGAKGATGKAGSDGAAGTNGTNGTNGTAGVAGKDGVNGTNGVNGMSVSIVRQAVDEDSMTVAGNKVTFSCAPGGTAIGAGYVLGAADALLGSDKGVADTDWVLTFENAPTGISGSVLCSVPVPTVN